MPLLFHYPADQIETVILVINGELAGKAQRFRLPPHDTGGGRMESPAPEPGRGSVQQPPDPMLHLSGGLVGEGHREDAVRRHTVPVDQSGNAHGQDSGLARARPRQDQQRPFDMLDRFPLRRVQRGLQFRRRSLDHVSRPASGTRIAKQVPRSTGSSINTPPCASSTTRRESASPIPQPPRLVVIPGSNNVRRSSFATPGPSSMTRMTPI